MNLFGLLKNQPPEEVIKAACDFYGISTPKAAEIHTKPLKALADNIWLVEIDTHTQAVVTYAPGSGAIVAPWYN